MLMQNDPFRDFDALFGRLGLRPAAGSMMMPIDAYRRDDDVWVHLDLPGVAPDSLDISVERGVLTVSAERDWQREDRDELYLTERPRGRFRRQVHLGDNLDIDGIEANFADGVVTLRIPVAEQSKPRKIPIGTSQPAIDVESTVSG